MFYRGSADQLTQLTQLTNSWLVLKYYKRKGKKMRDSCYCISLLFLTTQCALSPRRVYVKLTTQCEVIQVLRVTLF